MTTYYFKEKPIIAPLVITSNHPSWDKDAISLATVRTGQSAQRWELSFTVISNESLANYLVDLVTNLDTPQVMVMPQLTEVEARTTSTAGQTSGAAVAGASSVTVTGLLGLIPKGCFIQFANHTKIYLVKNDVTNSGTLSIYPSLTKDVPSLTALKHTGSIAKPSILYLQQIDNVRGISFSDGVLMDAGTISIKEVL